MVSPAVSPLVPNYANRIPYITTAEYLADPNGVDTSNLVPDGSYQQNVTALGSTIARASSWVDSQAYQVLAATVDTQVGRYRMRSDGTIWVPVDQTPLVQVNAVSWGWYPGQLTTLTDLSALWLQRKTVQVPLLSANGGILTPPGAYAPAWPSPGDRVYVQVTYVNGFANTTIPAATSAAATSVVVASALGIVPGLPMTLTDGVNSETVTVGTGYTNGSTTVPISATVNSYLAGASLSSLPPAIKQACISLTTALVKVRGTAAFEMASITEQPGKQALIEAGGLEDLEIAIDLLEPFRRVR